MEKSNSFLETEKIGTLMKKYYVPCIISLLVAALYNIVDQIFIANAGYPGSYGNAASTVVFPLTVAAPAIAVMIGDGCCSFVSLSLGAGCLPCSADGSTTKHFFIRKNTLSGYVQASLFTGSDRR